MSTGAIVIIIVAVIVLALVAWLGPTLLRSQQLRRRFGSEYDRAIEAGQDRRTVERELLERQRRHAQLDIKSLDEAARGRFVVQWQRVQVRFVDDPGAAVVEADRLVTAVMRERGYPTDGYEQQAADLSVRHAGAVGHYRSAHDITDGAGDHVSTEERRQAMLHYRAMFEDLVTDVDDQAGRREHAVGAESR